MVFKSIKNENIKLGSKLKKINSDNKDKENSNPKSKKNGGRKSFNKDSWKASNPDRIPKTFHSKLV